MTQTHVTIVNTKGETNNMPVATWDAIGILVNAHYLLMTDIMSCNARKADKAKQGAELLTRVIKRMHY